MVEHEVSSLIEFGCGDGRQLALARYPSYLGIDISPDAVALCREKFATDPGKAFMLADDYRGQTADAALSLDVIFHLVEDGVYRAYMDRLFAAADKYVVIYSTVDEAGGRTLRHVRHRKVADDVAFWFPAFERMSSFEATLAPPDPSWNEGARFLLYARK
ncbi:hypothetical protein CSC71_08805 [Pseudoxanthomonas sangjuensis]|nr:hypothetical protein CSC71_08805 [Pseudoxanthomonas sangjuensis]